MAQGNPKYAFFEGQIVPIERAQVSITTHAFNYGTGAFGGLRGYWNADERQMYVFRPLDHFERLLNSASLLRMAFDYTPADLTRILLELLNAEGFDENCYIRPLVYKSEKRLGVTLLNLACEFAMFAQPSGNFVVRNDDEGLHVCVSGWRRLDDNAIPARGKIVGAYVNSCLIKSDAQLVGYDDALVLDQEGHISEFSGANVFIIRKGQVITPPITANILEGITRNTAITLLRDTRGMEVIERPIDRTEAYLAEEMFMCGTGAQIAGVSRIEHRQIGIGRVGPVTAQLRALFAEVVTGRVPEYHDWLMPVYQPVKV